MPGVPYGPNHPTIKMLLRALHIRPMTSKQLSTYTGVPNTIYQCIHYCRGARLIYLQGWQRNVSGGPSAVWGLWEFEAVDAPKIPPMTEHERNQTPKRKEWNRRKSEARRSDPNWVEQRKLKRGTPEARAHNTKLKREWRARNGAAVRGNFTGSNNG